MKYIVVLLVPLFVSCGDGMINEYLNGNGLIWTNARVNVDSFDSAEITVQENGKGPELTVHYCCEEYDIDKLYKINAELIVDGKVVTPTYDSLMADYAVGASVVMSSDSCCGNLVKQMDIDSAEYMDSFAFSIIINKKYEGLKELPKRLSVHFTSESVGGNTDTTIVLTLRSSEDTRVPIRIH